MGIIGNIRLDKLYITMYKKIYNQLIEAEKDGKEKIEQVFNEYFSEYENDCRKMAILDLVLNKMIKRDIDEDLGVFYVELWWRIIRWMDSLDWDDHFLFRELTNRQCMIEEEYPSKKDKLRLLCEVYSAIDNQELKDEILDCYSCSDGYCDLRDDLKELWKEWWKEFE